MVTWILALLLSAPPAAVAIVDRPLPEAAARCAAMAAYLRAHAPALPRAEGDCHIVPRVVVLHWTATSTADAAWSTFAPTRLAGRPELRGGGDVNVGAHFLVDRDGTVLRLLPDDVAARHVIGLNHVAIGIENVGGPDAPLTPAQVEANAALVRALAARWPLAHVLGHHEYRRMESTDLFHEVDPAYRTVKPDPGSAFVDAVRAAVSDLGLRGPP